MSRGEPFQGEVPPPMDDGWWASVLKDETRSSAEPGRRPAPINADRPAAVPAEDWLWARRLFDADEPIDLPVIGHNRGGILVQAKALRGFVPISHLLDIPAGLPEGDRLRAMAAMVGRTLHLKVIEYDPEKGRLVLSERAAQAAAGRRTEVLEGLRPSQRIQGTITNLTAFGAFVDLGGIEGLIHVSELSWGRVRHPSDVVRCGQTVEAIVLSVDPDQGRIGLSLKLLEPDPWLTVEDHYRVGEVVEGSVTNVVPFGAFVCIERGLEGLIHVSEISDGPAADPRSILREGEVVRARIVRIDAGARRLGLSLRETPTPESGRPAGRSEPEAIAAG
ncbi:MAG TPA: S1 RNA-binding domain-containing protein [Anaerolineales bacterium]|nr:S1 RNA-binding domain-containing protein [Anaerolineales bacterium]